MLQRFLRLILIVLGNIKFLTATDSLEVHDAYTQLTSSGCSALEAGKDCPNIISEGSSRLKLN